MSKNVLGPIESPKFGRSTGLRKRQYCTILKKIVCDCDGEDMTIQDERVGTEQDMVSKKEDIFNGLQALLWQYDIRSSEPPRQYPPAWGWNSPEQDQRAWRMYVHQFDEQRRARLLATCLYCAVPTPGKLKNYLEGDMNVTQGEALLALKQSQNFWSAAMDFVATHGVDVGRLLQRMKEIHENGGMACDRGVFSPGSLLEAIYADI